MKKPTKEDFGYIPGAGWTDQDEMNKYVDAVCAWEIRPRKSGGRPRSVERPIHPSWNGYIENFDPIDPTRSQGAFCRWSGIRPSSLSAAKRKPITDRIELKLSEWIEELQK